MQFDTQKEKAFLSSVTDCYQPCEKKYERTHALPEQLQGSGISISIATKSDLVLRDLDLIKSFPGARVSFSINTLDEDFRKQMDRGVSIERRLAAMEVFSTQAYRRPALFLRSSPASPTRKRS